MGLVPEFFIMLGIAIFLSTSLLSAILDDDLPHILRYIFQGAAVAGLAILLLDPGGSATSVANFWIGILYLLSGVASEVGINIYLVRQGGKVDLVMTLCGFVTVPMLALTAIVVTSYFGPGGDLSLTPTSVMIIVVAGVGVSLSVSGFFRDAVKHLIRGRPLSPSANLRQNPLTETGPSYRTSPFSNRGDDEWEESPKGKKVEE
jgi:drug/metabolite transporter (DMT)-like permease